jgi:hypothetical protein
MFLAFMAMNLLGLICRLCKSDKQALTDFSKCLNEVEGKYFIRLPIKGFHVKQDDNWFTLPYLMEAQRNDDLFESFRLSL